MMIDGCAYFHVEYDIALLICLFVGLEQIDVVEQLYSPTIIKDSKYFIITNCLVLIMNQ